MAYILLFFKMTIINYLKRKEILVFQKTHSPKEIVLSEINQIQRVFYNLTYAWNLEKFHKSSSYQDPGYREVKCWS